MFLTPEEVRELTGRIQHQAQVKVLRSLGLIFKVRADGSALVLRAHVEKELGGLPDSKIKEVNFQPDYLAGVRA